MTNTMLSDRIAFNAFNMLLRSMGIDDAAASKAAEALLAQRRKTHRRLITAAAAIISLPPQPSLR
ncbi:MAG: hypothetical protein IJ343_05145 [Clostridia bacterium]|nr:hypothetical protein [Clostridia bacterium]